MRPLAVKSMSGRLAKTKKGEHVGSTAPFGYVKSKSIKNAWEIDEAAAATIRRVYALALDGLGITEIAKTLNSEGIPTPLTHRVNNKTDHLVCHRTVDDVPLWRNSTVNYMRA